MIPGWEGPLEEEMATHSRILAQRIPWTEEPSRLQFMGQQRVGHDWAKPHTQSLVSTPLFSSHEHFQVNDYVFSPHKDFSDFVFPSCDFILFSFFKYTFTLKNCGSGTLVNNSSALKTTSGSPAGSHTASAKSQMDAFFSSTEDHSCLSMLGFIQTCWHVGTVKEVLLCGCKGPGKLRWTITGHHLCLILSLIW